MDDSKPGSSLHSKRRRLEAQVAAMDAVRDLWTTAWWRDCRDYILPQHGQFNLTDRTQVTRNTSKIIDSTATIAARTFANGMLVGVVSPARAWFNLGLEDVHRQEYKPIALWLETVRDIMLKVFRESNFYNSAQSAFLNLGVFGTSAMGMYEDFKDIIRYYPYPIGAFSLANNVQRRVDQFSHRCQYTVAQLVEKFGLEACSDQVKTLWRAGQTQAHCEVVQLVCPNPDADATKLESRYKPFLSYYYEPGTPEDKQLGESGFDEFPLVCPRFFTEGDDPYGQSPAMDLLGDIKALQVMHRHKAQAVEKMVKPPLMGPSSLRSQQISTQPDKINYVDVRDGMTGLQPIYQMNFPVGEVRQDIMELRRSINTGLFSDLFLMLQQNDRREITAEEIRARQEEKILALSPLMERLDDEMLDPLIDRTFNMCLRFGLFPEPPEELRGQRLRVIYTSTMAQIQKSMSLGSSERLIGFTTNIAAQMRDPTIMDTVDLDATVRDYAMNLGVSPKILRDPEEVGIIREGRARAQAQQAKIEQAEIASKTAKNLSETDTSGQNALTDISREEA
jgi:hypothetical protein